VCEGGALQQRKQLFREGTGAAQVAVEDRDRERCSERRYIRCERGCTSKCGARFCRRVFAKLRGQERTLAVVGTGSSPVRPAFLACRSPCAFTGSPGALAIFLPARSLAG